MLKKKFLQGTVKRHPDGFGFFIPDNREHPDVYIPKHSMLGIMTNDKIMIEAFPEKGSDRFYGDVVKILTRFSKKVVGKYTVVSPTKSIITDDSKSWGSDIAIAPEDSMGATHGELVAIEIMTYPSETEKFTGRVVERIGNALDPMNDIKRMLFAHNIPHEFSKQTLEEAKRYTEHVDEKDFAGRKDIRNLDLITIDGATAKDFDDAVYVETSSSGFRVIVAIADVSHYVKLNTAIDKDAYERGTSVYFPNFVVPMLPEVLSNGLCSLNPHLPRLALVADMQLDFAGVVQKSEFYEAVMESKARVTYGEAQEIVDGTEIEKLKHVKEAIIRCSDVAKILMAKRFREGSLDLEIPETELEIDASGVPVDVIRSERLFAHRLIEELMLLANVEVAKFLSSKDIPTIYRIHDQPKEDSIYMLDKYLFNFGGKTRLRGDNLQKKLTKALEEFAGKPEALVLHILTLRSMAQAKYSTENIGHFGLGFEFYTHFTSPIRRYPDLIVHRLIKNQILPNGGYRLTPQDELATQATMLSACEQRSVKSERQLKAIKKARFMEKHVGQEFDGVISSVAKFGIFVLLREFDIDGLVHIEELGKEKFEYDEERLILIGTRSKTVYTIGDIVRIRVFNANADAGQIDFRLASSNQQQSSKADSGKAEMKFPSNSRKPKEKKSVSDNSRKTNRKDSKKRSETENDSGGVRKTRLSQRRGKNKSR